MLNITISGVKLTDEEEDLLLMGMESVIYDDANVQFLSGNLARIRSNPEVGNSVIEKSTRASQFRVLVSKYIAKMK